MPLPQSRRGFTTFTILARSERSGRAGIGLATVSIACGGLAPFYTPAGDIITSRAFCSPWDGCSLWREHGRRPTRRSGARQGDGDRSTYHRGDGASLFRSQRCRAWRRLFACCKRDAMPVVRRVGRRPGTLFYRAAPITQASTPFCACRRFSASSNTTECGPSITSASISSPR
jgi:hypothetical protein